jgi:hypothetical protein
MPVVGITHSSRKVLPGTPTIGTATDVGTNRAYNDGAIDVAFTPADLNATLYTASAYDNLAAVTRTATGTSSPIRITGFRSSASTTATVVASNAIGASSASAASNSVTATTVPLAPSTIGTLAVNGTGSLVLNTWGSVTNSSPTNGGKTISAYRARLFPGSLSSSTGDVASPGTTVWNSLTPGNSYTANGYAVNANGESAASPSSNSATVGQAPVLSTSPVFTSSYQLLNLTSGTWLNSPTSYTYQIATSLASLNAGTYVLNTTTAASYAQYNGGYGATYYGRVTATNAYGSATSGNVVVTTEGDQTPTIISNPQITPHPTLDRFTVTSGSWNYSPTSYQYFLYPGGGGTVIGSSAVTSATSFTFQDTMGYDIQYSTSYAVIVQASNAYGTGAAISPAASTVAYVPPTPVTPTGSISASNVTTTQATATFSVSNAASWEVVSSYVGGAFYLSGLNPSSPVTVSPVPQGATGVALGLNMWTGANRTGTLYQVSTNYDVPANPTPPGTPSISNSYSTGPSWTATWSASGQGTLTYYWTFYQSQTYGGTITATASGNTQQTSQSVNGNSAYGLWGYWTVYVTSSNGLTGPTGTSAWA